MEAGNGPVREHQMALIRMELWDISRGELEAWIHDSEWWELLPDTGRRVCMEARLMGKSNDLGGFVTQALVELDECLQAHGLHGGLPASHIIVRGKWR